MPKLLNVAIESAKIAGQILIKNFGKITEAQIETKNKNDFVTYVDKLSEEKIIGNILKSFPEHAILGEESGELLTRSEYRWIIDPLDGTTNFIHGVPTFAVSIALQKNNELILGVVYDPLRDELFHAEKGQGSYLNDKRIYVSKKEELANCLITTGFPYRTDDYYRDYVKIFAEFMVKTAGIRRPGAAVLDLAYTAAGRFDGFWEMLLKPWDIAAGAILIEEAGGVITDINGENTYLLTGSVASGNKLIHEQIIREIKNALIKKV